MTNRLLKNAAARSERIPRHKDRRAGLVQLVPRRVYDLVESFYESTIRRIVDRPSAMKVVEAFADPSYSPPLEKKGRTFKRGCPKSGHCHSERSEESSFC